MIVLTVVRKGTKEVMRTVSADGSREAWLARKVLRREFNMKKHRIESEGEK